MSESDIDIEEVRAWAHESGAIARSSFNRVAGRRKADRSYVTEADLEIERLLVERIAARYPEHGIIGEEQTRSGLDREFVWAIDPIDGTAAFVSGLPIWGVSLGLLRRGVPYLGFFHMPLLADDYWSTPGGAAFYNGAVIQVAAPHEWDGEDWIAVPSNVHRRYTIDFIGKVRSLGSVVADLCFVARGRAIGALASRSSIWDLAAGLAILTAAGGQIVGLSGKRPDPGALLDGGRLPEPIVAAGPGHLEQLRARIAVRR